MEARSSSFGKRGKRAQTSAAPVAASGKVPPNAMRITLMIAVPLVAIFVAGMVFLFVFFFDSRSELDAYLEPMFVRLAEGGWREEAVEDYASPALIQWLDRNDMEALTRPWQQFGAMVRYDGVKEFNIKTSGNTGEAGARVVIEFESGPTPFVVNLVRIGGKWYLNGLNLSEE